MPEQMTMPSRFRTTSMILTLSTISIAWTASAPTVAIAAQQRSQATIRVTAYQEPETQQSVRPFGEPSVQAPAPTSRGQVTDERINSIHDRISLIKKIVEQEKLREKAELERQAQAKKDVVDQMNAKPIQAPESETSAQPSDLTKKPDNDSAGTNEPVQDAQTELTPTSGTPIAAKPLNPFKLANSLFRTGNIEASRKSYEAGLADALPDDRAWLQCFIGCCYRLEGNYDKSESTFRDLVNRGGQSYAVEYGKWCLDYLETRRNSKIQFQAIEADIDGVLASMKAKKDSGQ